MAPLTLTIKEFAQVLESAGVHVNDIDHIITTTVIAKEKFTYDYRTGLVSDGKESLSEYVADLLRTSVTGSKHWVAQKELADRINSLIAV